MQIEKDRAVTMHYTLKNDQGQVMDTSEGKEPLQFIFGAGLIIPGLRKPLKERSQAIRSLWSFSLKKATGYSMTH